MKDKGSSQDVHIVVLVLTDQQWSKKKAAEHPDLNDDIRMQIVDGHQSHGRQIQLPCMFD
jgi:hypothetical protein